MEIKKTPKADLENKKFLFREIGLVVALLLVWALFEHKTYDKSVSTLSDSSVAAAEEEMIPITQPEPPPMEQPKVIPVISEVINIVDDNVKLDNDLVISTEDDKNLGVQIMDYVEGTGNTAVEEVEEDIPAAVVEEKPKFMGGDENEFRNWVQKNFEYPEVARENGIQGRVFVQFVVSAEGKVVDVKILRSIDPSIDKELIRVMSMSPKWVPGKQRGKAVRVKYTLPINLQLR